jgi:hypothetical protein
MTILCKSIPVVGCEYADSSSYHGDAAMSAYLLYKEKKEGVLSTFPFGAFAFARLDDRLKDNPLWQQAKKETSRDPMGLTSKQPHIEFFTTEESTKP